MSVTKTEAGHRVVKDRSVALTPRQRSALILVDGKRSMAQLRTDTAAAGVSQEDLDRLFELGLVADGAPQVTAATAVATAAAVESTRQHKQRSPQERYADAYLIATRLTAGLGLRGFRLNLAVEAAADYDALCELAPKIREAVGPEKFVALDDALNDR